MHKIDWKLLKKYISNGYGHFITITRHKLTVMDLCFKVGLVKQGLLHDLSKYTPVEFWTGIRYYNGKKSPNAGEKKEKGYSPAWMHHKGINKHHFEYWFDVTYDNSTECKVQSAKMPIRYVLEMACDRIAACKTYNGEDYTDQDPLNYYLAKEEFVGPALHPDTRKQLIKILSVLAKYGERKAIAYMRWLMKKNSYDV